MFSCVHLVICIVILSIFIPTLFALGITQELLKTVEKRATLWGEISTKCLIFTPF
jgi:hypothetical protein